MFSLIKDIYQRRELLFILVDRNLKIRYKNSVLGFFWSLLTPLLFILIYAVFARILKFTGEVANYLQFLVVGIVVWQFLATCLHDSLHAVMGNANLVKKTSFPRFILPLAMTTANLVNFLLTCVVLVLYLVVSGIACGNLAIIPVVLLTQCALCLGLALIISSANVFFRDTEHILGVVTLAWFFLTPIFYSLQMQMDVLERSVQWLAFLNPMTGIVSGYRMALMSEASPGSSLLALSFAVSWAVLVFGILIFQNSQHRFADEL